MPGTALKAFLQSVSMVSRSGQAGVVNSTVKRTLTAVDGEVFDHAEADDVAVQFGILDLAQRFDDLFLRNIFHEIPLDANEL